MNFFNISSNVICNFISLKVIGIPGFNPGPFTLDGTNTYLVGAGKHRLLIDTGQGIESYKECLLDALIVTKTTSLDILITHSHLDHIGGIDQVRDLMTTQFNQELVKVYKRHRSDELSNECLPIGDHQIFAVEGATIEAVSTPGHTSDHTSFLLKETNALFSGDCILGKGSTVFESLVDFMKSLDRLKSLAPIRIYPGHGPMVDDAMKIIDQYIWHRKEREREIMSLITESPMDSQSIVSKIYKDYPQSVQNAALKSTILHLEKLLLEGCIVLEEGKYQLKR